jgi:hypothetical protein
MGQNNLKQLYYDCHFAPPLPYCNAQTWLVSDWSNRIKKPKLMQGVRVRESQNARKILHPPNLIVTRTLAYSVSKCQSCTGRIPGFIGVELFWVFVKNKERGYGFVNWLDIGWVCCTKNYTNEYKNG